MESGEVKKVSKGKQTHARDTCLLLTSLNSALGIIYLLYDSTGVLGMDDKKYIQ